MSTPVNKVNGIGPKTTEYLKTKKITTAEALLRFGVAKLALAPGFNPGRATNAINEAEKLISGTGAGSTAASKKAPAKKPKNKPRKNKPKDKAKKSDKKDKNSKNKKNKKGKKDKKKDKKKNKK